MKTRLYHSLVSLFKKKKKRERGSSVVARQVKWPFATLPVYRIGGPVRVPSPLLLIQYPGQVAVDESSAGSPDSQMVDLVE